MFTQYLVTTRHGDYNMVSSLEEAERVAKMHMKGYLEGTRSANDPMPKIQAVQFDILKSYVFDKDKGKYVNDWQPE